MAWLPVPHSSPRNAHLRRKAAGVAVLGTLALAACGGDSDDAPSSAAQPNRSPAISGTPSTAVLQGTQYGFTPSANDPDGNALTFSIENLPSWATFTTSSGRLHGAPTAADIGSYSSISITVSDGVATASLPAFNVQVVATASGAATLSWNAPTTNSDGSPLVNLAGFKVYWGTTRGDYPNSTTVSNPTVTIHIVEQLTPATWYFAISALNAQGIESVLTSPASKVIQ
jgi:putative Ig domain-containing protein